MAKGLFITATGTDAGKTYIAGCINTALWRRGRRAAYYKAAMSGNPAGPDATPLAGDALAVLSASGSDQNPASTCPYVYGPAYSPHLAGRLERRPVSLDAVLAGYAALAQEWDLITVEGSGGIVCPLNDDGLMLADFAAALDLPSVIVTGSGLGAINGVVLTAEYMRARGLQVKGIIMNNFHACQQPDEDNAAMCSKLSGLPVLACVAPGGALSLDAADGLQGLYAQGAL